MIIKLDIDGVLRDMITPMVQLYNEKFNVELTPEDVIDYDINISFPLFEKNGINGFKFFFDDNADKTITNAKSLNKASEATHLLHNNGHIIHIVSYQPSPKAQIETLSWLEKNNIYYDFITFTNTRDKTIVPCDMIIDDCPIYLDAEDDSVKKICIALPYNRNCRAIHYNSLMEFATFIDMFGI